VNDAFISYAKEDEAVARRLCNELSKAGLEPWLDLLRLTPGARWRDAIAAAIEDATTFVALISHASVAKTGFVQKELRMALDLLETMPPDAIYLLPVRVEDARPRHRALAALQWIDLFPNWDLAVARIVAAIRVNGPQRSRTSVGHDIESGRSERRSDETHAAIIRGQVLVRCHVPIPSEIVDRVSEISDVTDVWTAYGQWDLAVGFACRWELVESLVMSIHWS